MSDLVWDYESIARLTSREGDWTVDVPEPCLIRGCLGKLRPERLVCYKHRKLWRMPDEQVEELVRLYESGTLMTSQVAERFGVTTRQVQRLARLTGVIRTAEESRQLALKRGHWSYKRRPKAELKKRRPVPAKIRYELIALHPYCALCGAKASEWTRLEIDHMDGNPANNQLDNLQVLCDQCNIGKGERNVA